MSSLKPLVVNGTTGETEEIQAGDNLSCNVTGSSGSCTGNAATVTTNANLTGDVTSVGNASTFVRCSGAHITYVPIGGNIETYASMANAGDTLVLASGVYTITDDIDITQAINIVGQGVSSGGAAGVASMGTVIYMHTTSKNVIHITASNVNISNLSIVSDLATGSTMGIYADGTAQSSPISNVNITNVHINMTGSTGNIWGIQYADASGTIRDTVVKVTTTSTGMAFGIYVQTGANADIPTIVDVYNADSYTSSNGSTYSIAFLVQDNNAASVPTLNLYNCRGYSTGVATNKVALMAVGIAGHTIGVANAENCVFQGDGYDVAQGIYGGTINLRNCTLVNNTTSGVVTSYTGVNEIIGSNITYVPIGGDINTYITNATAGDTLILAAGTYTITSAINVSKALNIVGQGVNQTTINRASSSATISMLNITASSVKISNLSVTGTMTGANVFQGIYVNGTDLTNCNLSNINVTAIGDTGSTTAIIYLNSSGTIRDVVTSTSTISTGSSYGFYARNNSSNSNTINIYNMDSTTSAVGAVDSEAFRSYPNNASATMTVNLYNSRGTSAGTATNRVAFVTTTNTYAVMNAENSVFNGSDYDVARLSSGGVITLKNCTLVNNTKFGLITYNGTVATDMLEAATAVYSAGIKWTSQTGYTYDNDWVGVTYGNGLFVAISRTDVGTNNRVMTSPDGINWTVRTSAEANSWQNITYGNGLFVAVASDGTHRVMTSPNGITWTARTAAAAYGWYNVIYGNDTFVATNIDHQYTMYSSDGITWTLSNIIPETCQFYGLTYGNGKFVAVANNGTARAMYSSDGITWTSSGAVDASLWVNVTYGNGKFVAVANGGTNRIAYSSDGITWTSIPAPDTTTSGWNCVNYGSGLFVATSSSGTVMTSPDGINWTMRTAAANNYWRRVAYGNGMFVSVASTGTGNRVMTSGKQTKYEQRTDNTYQGGMTVYGSTNFGGSSTDLTTMTSRFLPRVLAADPKGVTPPAGSVGEIAWYSGKLYICTAVTPIWELVSSS